MEPEELPTENPQDVPPARTAPASILPPPAPGRLAFLVAVAFEASLAAVAYGGGWLTGIDPGSTVAFTVFGALWGIAAALPLLPVLFCVASSNWPPFVRIRKLLDETLLAMLGRARVWELAVLSAAAGYSEELLFRGLLQSWFAAWVGGPIALVAASVLFGAVHAVTMTYFVIATLYGAYFGILWMVTGNLVVPMVGHAVYDFVALVYLLRRPISVIKTKCEDTHEGCVH